jgi:hypothetical protein
MNNKPTETKTMKTKTGVANKERAVVVTTAHRGVFFGYATTTDGEVIALKRARLCLYWSRDVRGFMGLAANGPSRECRIGPSADISIRAVTAVLEVTPEAAAKWEAAPWT